MSLHRYVARTKTGMLLQGEIEISHVTDRKQAEEAIKEALEKHLNSGERILRVKLQS